MAKPECSRHRAPELARAPVEILSVVVAAHAASLITVVAAGAAGSRLVFDRVDRRPLFGWNRLAAELHRDLRHGAVHECQQALLDQGKQPQLLLAHRLDLLTYGRNDRVREKNARERADQRRADQAAERLRRLVERAHRVDDAENGGDDAERRQAVGDRLKRVHRLVPVVRERLDFLVHQRLDFVRARVADDDQATIVADEGHQILVGEQFREGS